MIKQCAKKLLKIYYSTYTAYSFVRTATPVHTEMMTGLVYLFPLKIGVGRRASLCLYENCQRTGKLLSSYTDQFCWPFPLVKVNGNITTIVSEARRYEMQLGCRLCPTWNFIMKSPVRVI